jgi:hypothetical protein
MTLKKATCKKALLKKYSASYHHYKNDQDFADKVCSKQVFIIDAAQILEPTIARVQTAAEFMCVLIGKINEQLVRKGVSKVVITFDNEHRPSTKELEYITRYKDEHSTDEPFVPFVITDETFPVQGQWRKIKFRPVMRRELYRYITQAIKQWINNLGSVTYDEPKILILDPAVDDINEGYIQYSIDMNTHAITKHTSIMIGEGELCVMRHAYENIDPEYASVMAVNDGDIIPISVVNYECLINKRLYIRQDNRSKDSHDVGRVTYLDVTSFIRELKRDYGDPLVLIVLMIVSGNDFVGDVCKGIGFEEIMMYGKRFNVQKMINVLPWGPKGKLFTFHVSHINKMHFQRTVADIFYNKNKKCNISNDQIDIVRRNAIWNLDYWANQARLPCDGHIVCFDPFMTVESIPVYGYHRIDGKAGSVSDYRVMKRLVLDYRYILSQSDSDT